MPADLHITTSTRNIYINLYNYINKKSILTAVLGIGALYITYKRLVNYVSKRPLYKAAEKQQAKRAKSISIVKQQYASLREEIRKLNNEDLIKALNSGKYTPTQVLHAYQEAAIVAHELTNCATEFVIDAEKWARQLESDASVTGYVKGPLYGVPFSVKESNSMIGFDRTRGYVRALGHPEKTNATLVQILINAGAIPFVRTNVPQSLLAYSCSNPIYGRTTNPYNSMRTSGGSSGGEAAIIACNGTPFGVGGDVGGSIRIPATFCGITGIKPTMDRLPNTGSMGSVPGRPLICACSGPMARDVFTLELIMTIWCNSKLRDYDFYVVPMPWRPIEKTRKLTIGYLYDDAWFPCVPAVVRGVKLAKSALEQRGHRLVEFHYPVPMSKMMPLFAAAATVDSCKYLLGMMNQDIIEEDHKEWVKLMSFPHWFRSLSSRFLGQRIHNFVNDGFPQTTGELRVVYEKITGVRSTFMKAWKSAGIDVLICPPLASLAMRYDTPMKTPAAPAYSSIFNMLDYPAGVVTVSHATQEDIRQCALTYDKTKDDWAKNVYDCNSTDEAIGLPIGVQCVAAHLEEELCVYAMKELESAIKELKN